MSEEADTPDVTSLLPGLLVRPVQSLQELPVRYRWEFTRRHPYYLLLWENARDYRLGRLTDPLREALGRVASEVLLAIGVSGVPLPPTASADDLGVRQLGKIWEGGAVAPLSYRVLAAFIAELPRETRLRVGGMILGSCPPLDGTIDPEEQDAADRMGLARQLLAADDAALDRVPNRPVVGLNLYAPAKAIGEALALLVRDLKAAESIGERRRRTDKLDEYLRVWDLREGWTGGGYEPDRERTYLDVAKELGESVSTVDNRYRSSFELLCGHRYAFGIWFRLFRVLKIDTVFGPDCLRRRRPHVPRHRAGAVGQVTEASLGGGKFNYDGGLLAGLATAPADVEIEMRETAEHIEELIAQRADDRTILEDLQPCHATEMLRLIDYFRRRAVGKG